jgi:hypothetical protein
VIEIVRSVAAAPIEADTAEVGLDVLAHRLRRITRAEVAHAVLEGVRQGWMQDPVRMPPGALQFRWVLEPTERGRALTA